MWKTSNVFHRFFTIGLMIKIHQIFHVADRMAALREPGSEDHILFCFLNAVTVQDSCFNVIHRHAPPL